MKVDIAVISLLWKLPAVLAIHAWARLRCLWVGHEIPPWTGIAVPCHCARCGAMLMTHVGG